MLQLLCLAEEGGFEPPIGALVPYNGLANRRLQPLGHPSKALFYAPCGSNPERAQAILYHKPQPVS